MPPRSKRARLEDAAEGDDAVDHSALQSASFYNDKLIPLFLRKQLPFFLRDAEEAGRSFFRISSFLKKLENPSFVPRIPGNPTPSVADAREWVAAKLTEMTCRLAEVSLEAVVHKWHTSMAQFFDLAGKSSNDERYRTWAEAQTLVATTRFDHGRVDAGFQATLRNHDDLVRSANEAQRAAALEAQMDSVKLAPFIARLVETTVAAQLGRQHRASPNPSVPTAAAPPITAANAAVASMATDRPPLVPALLDTFATVVARGRKVSTGGGNAPVMTQSRVSHDTTRTAPRTTQRTAPTALRNTQSRSDVSAVRGRGASRRGSAQPARGRGRGPVSGQSRRPPSGQANTARNVQRPRRGGNAMQPRRGQSTRGRGSTRTN